MVESGDGLSSFQLNSPDVVAEIIEGEVVLVHMGTGRYYSLQDCGAAAWSLLAAGLPESAAAGQLAAHYGAPEETVRSGLRELTAQLEAEQLLVKRPSEVDRNSPVELSRDFGSVWEAPLLQGYDDMGELLLVDPIHDVSDEGWPNTE